MGVFTSSFTSDLTAVLIGLLVCITAFYKWSFTYWKRSGLPVLSKPSIPFGNFANLFMRRKSFGTCFMDLYRLLKATKHTFGGFYMLAKPILVVADPILIKNIMQTNFQHFVNHGTFANQHNDPLSANLFNMEDDVWKNWRVKLTPTFTTGKMKMMFETLINTTGGLRNILTEAASTKKPINLKDTTARFTTDVIGSVAFGIECNSLKNPESSFRRYGKRAIEDVSVIDHIKLFLQFAIPHKWISLMNIRLTNKSVEDFFMGVVKDTVHYREKNNIYRKDFMHLLLQLRNKGKLTDDESIKGDTSAAMPHLTMEEVTAQCFLFFLAGFETSSTVSTFALYEMAKNPQIQNRLRDEIVTVLEKHNNKLTYEALAEMEYLDQVVNESLRMYPPVPSLFRVCSKDYGIPDFVIKKGIQVHIPIMGIQRDSEYYPDPDKFDPDRFTPENKKARVPFTFMPFGEGPRICIGLRFGIMQAKVLIATIILNSKLRVNSQMKKTLEYKTNGFVTAFKDAIYLDVEQV